ncbi:hypothetical protein EDB83DRAFT_2322604 [Lactarius deliciosus]|nr:hypothetical protein EDB83DRAFT_2322604 [Lactarius deliciosus]
MSLYSLTEEELTLHSYAALVHRDLEAYRVCASGDEVTWKTKLEGHLRQAMNYFEEAARGCQTPPRVHPLLLSLAEAWNTSDTSPDIHSISENDPRVIGNPYYIVPSELPPLNSFIPGNNNESPENSASEPQGSSGEGTSNAHRTGSTSAAALQINAKGKQALETLGEYEPIGRDVRPICAYWQRVWANTSLSAETLGQYPIGRDVGPIRAYRQRR